MLFYEKELANKENFKVAVDNFMKANYTNEEEPKEEMYEKIGQATEAIRAEILSAIEMMPEKAFPVDELAMPTLWIETTDSFDMAYVGDYSGCLMCLQELLDWVKAQSC